MIEVNNSTKTFLNKGLLRKIGRRVLKKEGIRGKYEVSVALVAEKEIKQLNKVYRKKDEATDVLSFSEDSKFVFPLFQKRYLGEIIICPLQVKRKLLEKSGGMQKGLMRVFVHGLLHLLGYTHRTEKDAEIMEAKEENYLTLFFKN